MKNIKNFEFFNESSNNSFNKGLIMWQRKPESWDVIRRSVFLSHLNDKAREDLIDNYIKGNIYDSTEYQMSYPTKYFEDIWGGGESPRFFVVKHYTGLTTGYYLVDTEGYNYSKYVVRISDLEKWVNIEENLY